jgi:hypothetical protein
MKMTPTKALELSQKYRDSVIVAPLVKYDVADPPIFPVHSRLHNSIETSNDKNRKSELKLLINQIPLSGECDGICFF